MKQATGLRGTTGITDGSRELEEVPASGRYRSPLRYPGGKQKAIDQISMAFPRSVAEYREPMVGGGSVYFHSRTVRLAQRYWINDKFDSLISFWRGVQDPETCLRLQKELEQLRSGFASAEEIKEYYLRAREQPSGDDYREALLFFFFNRVTFSGTTRAGGFSRAAALRRFTVSSIKRLRSMPEALASTRITNLDFEEVIDEPGRDVFVFLDPPYFTATRLYGHGGSLHVFDHARLARCLKRSAHRFLITYDDCDEIRKLYRWANLKTWSLQYGMNNCNALRESKVGSELFIANY